MSKVNNELPLNKNNQQITTSDQYVAALDIGSNSFHFVLARLLGDQIQLLHREKYQAKLAQGLNDNNILSDDAIERGVNILANLSETTKQLTTENFRVIATYTLRQAKNADKFLKAAAKVFPFDIEIVSGHEEARLIYQGVNHHLHSKFCRLVIDIGGGSTECIVGTANKVSILDSLNIGCVSFTKSYFSDGEITKQAFKRAIKAAKHEVDTIAGRFTQHSWKSVIGTSGTIKSVYRVINENEHLAQPATLKQLHKLMAQLIEANHVNNLKFNALKESRRAVFPAGLAILIATMETLEISELEYCAYALREGVLYEQIVDYSSKNIRKRTINSLVERFNIDICHAKAVNNQASELFKQLKSEWGLEKRIYQELLSFSILLHELGLDINPSGYHKHGEYILTHSDLPGFNKEQQQALSWLVGNQRKKITPLIDEHWYLLPPKKLLYLCVIMRLSILLCQQRHKSMMPNFDIAIHQKEFTLYIENQWLIDRPIVETELFFEIEQLNQFNFTLIVTRLL